MEEPDAFFPLLDALTDPDAFPGKEEVSHEAQQQRALHTSLSVGYLSKPGALELVRAHLGLHSATPKIVAFYQHYLEKTRVQHASNETERCGSWVDWYGRVICDVDELIRVTGSETLDPAKSSFSLSVCPRSTFLVSHRNTANQGRYLKSSPSIIFILQPIVAWLVHNGRPSFMLLFSPRTSGSSTHIYCGCPVVPHQGCSISSDPFLQRNQQMKRATSLAMASL